MDFLKKEISEEKKEAGRLPKVTGFKVETAGPNVKFIKSSGDET